MAYFEFTPPHPSTWLSIIYPSGARLCHTIIQQKIDGTAKYCEHKTWSLFSQNMSLKYMVLVLYIILLLIVTMYHLAIDFDTIFKASLVHLQ